jgi:hypothetical protein
MPKGRYSESTGDRIVNAVRELGSARAAYTQLGITATNYYRWLRERPELDLRVEIAKKEYHQNQDRENIDLAKGWIKRLLTEGDRTTRQTTKEVIIAGKIVTLEETVRIQRPCPSWVVDRVLGRGETLAAIQTLVSEGLIPTVAAVGILEVLKETQAQISSIVNAAFEQN